MVVVYYSRKVDLVSIDALLLVAEAFDRSIAL